jgi:enoyl-CoA hydratase
MLAAEQHDSITVLRMVRGKGNALNTEFLNAIVQGLDQLERSTARGVVLTGEGQIFCAGVDLPAVTAGGAAYLQGFLPALTQFFRKLLLFPKPVVAAVNGHAIAGGCIGMLACDYRLLAQGNARIGLTELLVGVPFPTGALEIARFGIPARHLQEVIYTGRTYQPADALQRGLVDEVVPPDQLLPRAIDIARQLAEVPAETFHLTKRQLRAPLLETIAQRSQQNDAEVSRLWADPAIVQKIEQFVAKTVKRGS